MARARAFILREGTVDYRSTEGGRPRRGALSEEANTPKGILEVSSKICDNTESEVMKGRGRAVNS